MQYEDRLSNEMLLYFVIARGNGKSRLAMEKYRKLVGISDEEWDEILSLIAIISMVHVMYQMRLVTDVLNENGKKSESVNVNHENLHC